MKLTKKILEIINDGGRVNFEHGYRIFIVSVYRYTKSGTKLIAKESKAFKDVTPELWEEWNDLEDDIIEAIDKMWSHVKAIN